ncbi:hypothetical protein PROAA_1430019 [Candidatus Propionivibrio aalborgensis]|uniref:Uncharacterized protein n=1 Tax=Candidatus Propionivibrio aalborgensis TaxID=1860101 RepID=A0A1A8XMH3_9RHOO|nr:hypothetical protein PROAA_1430019 [Candidatus Propionivibrio aalborgensis]
MQRLIGKRASRGSDALSSPLQRTWDLSQVCAASGTVMFSDFIYISIACDAFDDLARNMLQDRCDSDCFIRKSTDRIRRLQHGQVASMCHLRQRRHRQVHHHTESGRGACRIRQKCIDRRL